MDTVVMKYISVTIRTIDRWNLDASSSRSRSWSEMRV